MEDPIAHHEGLYFRPPAELEELEKAGRVVFRYADPASGKAGAMGPCARCGAGQLRELNVAKDARRGDLRKIVGGLALVPTKSRSLYGFIREGLPDEIKS